MDQGRWIRHHSETARSYLDEAYERLGYEDGMLLDAVERPGSMSREADGWLDKGEWLALARKVGAEKVFFVDNNPVIVFCGFADAPSAE